MYWGRDATAPRSNESVELVAVAVREHTSNERWVVGMVVGGKEERWSNGVTECWLIQAAPNYDITRSAFGSTLQKCSHRRPAPICLRQYLTLAAHHQILRTSLTLNPSRKLIAVPKRKAHRRPTRPHRNANHSLQSPIPTPLGRVRFGSISHCTILRIKSDWSSRFRFNSARLSTLNTSPKLTGEVHEIFYGATHTSTVLPGSTP
ncbi:hypothetical protein B0H17DRAFT_1136259 [Mycena rosella]|uniref:Uncharacterized protein n=1 Tax=Mycena rosella TaxID=1033263 RepID=A0AAD7DBT1_MYCRO|nr:hypothetical protein B0H17DRAFT_1136259 [Mycena rosella]